MAFMAFQFIYCEVIRWAWKRDANKIAGLEGQLDRLRDTRIAAHESGNTVRQLEADLEERDERIIRLRGQLISEREGRLPNGLHRNHPDHPEYDLWDTTEKFNRLCDYAGEKEDELDTVKRELDELRDKNAQLIRHFDLESDVYYLPRNIDGSVHRNTQNKLSRLWLERLAFEGNKFAVELVNRVRAGEKPQSGIFIANNDVSN